MQDRFSHVKIFLNYSRNDNKFHENNFIQNLSKIFSEVANNQNSTNASEILLIKMAELFVKSFPLSLKLLQFFRFSHLKNFQNFRKFTQNFKAKEYGSIFEIFTLVEVEIKFF